MLFITSNISYWCLSTRQRQWRIMESAGE